MFSFTRQYCICNLTLNTANKYSQIKRGVFFQLPQPNCYLTTAWISRGAPHTSIQTLCKHQHHGLTQAELSLTSVKLHPINLPECWHEAAHSWQARPWWGWGQVVSNGLYCEKLLSECTTYTGKREHCLSLCAPRFLSLGLVSPPLLLTLIQYYACRVRTWGVEEKQLCLVVTNPIHRTWFTSYLLLIHLVFIKCG